MLQAPGGATIEAMARATKWQPHSVRGFLAGVVRKKLGLFWSRQHAENGRVYRITDGTASAAAPSAMRANRDRLRKKQLECRWTMRSRICAISISMACGRAGRACSGNSRLLISPAICCLPFSPTGSRPMSGAISHPATVRLLKQIATSGDPLNGRGRTDEFGRRRAELKPGTILTREWNAQAYRVMVVDEGFAWNGKTYDSLSKLAFAITGTNWNGPRFFGLRDKISPEAKS